MFLLFIFLPKKETNILTRFGLQRYEHFLKQPKKQRDKNATNIDFNKI